MLRIDGCLANAGDAMRTYSTSKYTYRQYTYSDGRGIPLLSAVA